MHAIRLYEFGPAENLSYEEVPDPVPAAGQVRIAVEAAGVHLVDTALRAGAYSGGPMPAPDLPTIPGREVAGTVDAVVIVTAAAGGLGSLFVQEAGTVGATVVGLAGGRDKTDLVRSLGADV